MVFCLRFVRMGFGKPSLLTPFPPLIRSNFKDLYKLSLGHTKIHSFQLLTCLTNKLTVGLRSYFKNTSEKL